MWWDNSSILKWNFELFADTFKKETSIYIGVGKEGLAPTTIPHVMEVEANLLVEKLKASKSNAVNVLFDYLPQENHATIMQQTVFECF